MTDSSPTLIVLHGDDEFGILSYLKKLEERIGDPTTREMNITRFKGTQWRLEQLRNDAYAMPFMANRRLVIVEDGLSGIRSKQAQTDLQDLFAQLPPSTTLVLTSNNVLKESSWVIKYAKMKLKTTLVKDFSIAKGPKMAKWIRQQAREMEGEITNEAAYLLAEVLNNDPRLIALELEKLVIYVAGKRMVDVDDVENLVAFTQKPGDFFKLIDLVGAKNTRQALDMLERLYHDQNPTFLFFGLVGHFRLLLQTREIIEKGGSEQTTADTLHIHPYRAKKLFAQAMNLRMMFLEEVYHRLLELDLGVKTGKIKDTLALEVLIMELTQ